MSSFITVRLKAPNDSKGNPRRLWVLLDVSDGAVVLVVEEGYKGDWVRRAATEKWDDPEILSGPEVCVSAAEYGSWINTARKTGLLAES